MDCTGMPDIQNTGWYLDRIVECRRTKDWEKLKSIYDYLKQLGLDIQIPVMAKRGGVDIFRKMTVPEAFCRMLGPDDVMLDVWPDLALVVCEGTDDGLKWGQTRTFSYCRRVFPASCES